MKRLRYYLRLLGAFVTRFKFIIIFGVIVGFLVALFSAVIFPRVINNNTKRVGLVGRYHVDNLPIDVVNLVSGGLTGYSADGSSVPLLADNWQTDDGKAWTFRIKADVEWQDGTAVTPQDVIYEFTDVEIQRPDESTIVFHLKEPFSPFPSVVSKPLFKKGLIGFGEWSVDKIRLSGSYVNSLSLKSDNGNIDFKFFPNEERAKLAYKLGKVDRLEGLLDPSPFGSWERTQTVSAPDKYKVVALLFNTEDPLLSDKSVRQGLTYGIDKSFDQTRAISPISPSSWAYNPQVKNYAFDTERAKDLLSNVPDELKSIPIKIASTPGLLTIAEEIEKYWEDLGFEVEVQVTSLIPSEYQSYLTIIDIPKDPDQYPYWHSTQVSSNLTKLSNPRIDKLLEDGRAEINQEKRKKIYFDFQRFLLEEAPAVFLYHPQIYSIQR
ncbi:ABC transporter substrate-binding protein [Patescibacteria group bacterium]